jgi:hypothetical protein
LGKKGFCGGKKKQRYKGYTRTLDYTKFTQEH